MAAKTPKRMSEEAFDAIAQRFRILSEPLRLRLLHELQEKELTVGELTERTGATQPNVSKHLSLLAGHGLVRRRQQGTSVYYAIADPSIFALCEQVCGGIERSLEEKRKVFG